MRVQNCSLCTWGSDFEFLKGLGILVPLSFYALINNLPPFYSVISVLGEQISIYLFSLFYGPLEVFVQIVNKLFPFSSFYFWNSFFHLIILMSLHLSLDCLKFIQFLWCLHSSWFEFIILTILKILSSFYFGIIITHHHIILLQMTSPVSNT